MLTESLVPCEPLIPSSTPESHGAGPIQMCGEYQGPCGCSKIAFVPGSMSAAAAPGSPVPGIGNSASGAIGAVGPVDVPAGGFHGSDGASVDGGLVGAIVGAVAGIGAAAGVGAVAAVGGAANVGPGSGCAANLAAG